MEGILLVDRKVTQPYIRQINTWYQKATSLWQLKAGITTSISWNCFCHYIRLFMIKDHPAQFDLPRLLQSPESRPKMLRGISNLFWLGTIFKILSGDGLCLHIIFQFENNCQSLKWHSFVIICSSNETFWFDEAVLLLLLFF